MASPKKISTSERRPIAPSPDATIAAIQAYARHKRWTRYRLAKEAQIGQTTLRDFYRPNWNPSLDVVRILYALIPPDFDPATVPPPNSYDDEEFKDATRKEK
jgi:hypothetical protein